MEEKETSPPNDFRSERAQQCPQSFLFIDEDERMKVWNYVWEAFVNDIFVIATLISDENSENFH